MRRVLKWIGVIVGALIGLILLVAAGFYTKSRLEFSHRYSVQVESVQIPTDTASLERGKHLATILCTECHAADLGGTPDFFEGGPIGSAAAPNLTAGTGGLGSDLTNEDFVRVLRHGVKPDGTSVFIMPAHDFYYMKDTDLGALIAYLRTIPAVDRQTPEPHVRITPIGGVMYGLGAFGNLLRASEINQTARPPAASEPGVTPGYGKYLVDINGCRDCHGAQLAGGKPGDPSSPLAPNLTPGGELRAWSEAQFISTLRTGVTPSGTLLPPRFMPWKFKGQMTDDELKAVWAYLSSLPSLPTSTAPAE
jgi:mono/diheme cytochrome c family protein